MAEKQKLQSRTMNETELNNIIEKCKNYEISVQKTKIDMSYIKQLKISLKEYKELVKILPDKNGSSFEMAD